MYSQHTKSIAIYNILKNYPLKCNETLGVDSLGPLIGASQGASGAKLLKARNHGYPVVIKAFPVSCPFKYIRSNQRRNNTIRDYGDFEIGTGIMLTETFILTHLSQNIVTCYNYTICDYSYETELSLCHKTPIPRQSYYPIINDVRHPLYSYYDPYFTPLINGVVETPQRDDITRYFMVEQCEGDLQGFIETNHTSDLLLDILDRVVLMIFHTLLLFDIVLGGYSHNDLGLRNVLYVTDTHSTCDTYNRYIFPNMDSIDISTQVIIPKIWDYAYVRYRNADDYKMYYSYIDAVPNYDNIKEENRENDVFVFLQDLDQHLRKFGITTSIFNRLNLGTIRECTTNTDAINEYFYQNPIRDFSNNNQGIIHTFPIDISIYDHVV